jgi:hypothetical protein
MISRTLLTSAAFEEGLVIIRHPGIEMPISDGGVVGEACDEENLELRVDDARGVRALPAVEADRHRSSPIKRGKYSHQARRRTLWNGA